MSVEEQIRSWLHRVDSEKYLTSEVVISIMNNIAELNAFEIGRNIELVAYLFCDVLRKNNGEEKIEEISLVVCKAFESIQKIDTEREYSECADVKIIQFLNKIYYKNIEASEEPLLSNEDIRKDFQALAENLERISIIFKLQIGDNILFKIGSLLKDIITKWNPCNFSLSLEEMNVIFLAIQIFQYHQDEEIDALLEQIIEKYNLKFLDYMRQSRIVLLGGSEQWRKNYLKNGVLVIADIEKRKILIRSESKKYLGNNYEVEKNANGQEIAYFKEDSFSDGFIFSDANDILQRGNDEQLRNLLKLMMAGYTNTFLEKSLLVKGDEIQVVNNYSINDKYYILQDGDIVKNLGFNSLGEYLEPYRFRAVVGNHIDCVTLGTLISLQNIQSVSYDDLFPEQMQFVENVQNQVIMNWLKNIPNPLSGWYQWKEFYYNELHYVKNKNDYLNQSFKGLRLYPVQIDCNRIQEFLLQVLFAECYEEGKLCNAVVKNDFEEGITFEVNYGEEKKRIDNENIIWMDENFKNCEFTENKGIVFWKDSVNKYFTGTELNRLMDTINDSKRNNERLLPVQILTHIVEDEIKDIQSYMDLQKEGLTETCDFNGAFEYIVRFRIAQQLCYFQIIEKDKYNAYIQLLRRHNKVDFEFLLSKKGQFFEKGILYVPKEKAERLGTLWYINSRILRSDTRRDEDYLYCTKLDYTEDGCFSFLGERINKIMFLFDTLQSGTSTKRSLSCYFEHKNDMEWKENKKQYNNYAQKYYDSFGKEIFIEDIIETNNIGVENIEVNCFYGTKEGATCIKNYCNEKGSGHDCINGIKVITDKTINEDAKVSDEDLEVMKRLFKKTGFIGNGSYMIVRKFSAAKQNIFPSEVLNPENIVSIFMQKREIS